MDEARSSWNTVYESKEGFECQITLRDEDETSLAERVKKVMTSIAKSGGTALKRRNHNNSEGNGGNNGDSGKTEKPEKTYVDDNGVRHCNLKLKSGKVCRSQVTERDGKYGPFWSCPNYKEHAA